MTSSWTPVWISHRGYKQNSVENTLQAFQEAVARGFSVLETDLRSSRDGHIVLAHDPTLERLCGDTREIATLSRSELQDISLDGGARLLFLDDFVPAFSNYGWIFDIKPEQGNRTIRSLYAWFAANKKPRMLQEQAKFVVWNAADESLLKRLLSKAILYPGERECQRAGMGALLGLPSLGAIEPGRTYSLTPRIGRFSLYRNFVVKRYREKNAKLLAFLPESEEDVHRALRLNFDEILTDGDILSV